LGKQYGLPHHTTSKWNPFIGDHPLSPEIVSAVTRSIGIILE
jgi:hypothetical protein